MLRSDIPPAWTQGDRGDKRRNPTQVGAPTTLEEVVWNVIPLLVNLERKVRQLEDRDMLRGSYQE